MSDSELYTEKGIPISRRVAEGRTILIPGIGYQQEKEAKRLSSELRTYFIYVYEKVGGRFKHCGYAVPK